MATGFVFVYLAILALVAPVVWLVWWALDSAASRPATVHPPAATPKAAKPVSLAPHPIDRSLPFRRDMVTVYSASGKELSTCAGPNAQGRCSRPLEDGTVPCAGCLLALPRPIRGSLDWQIPAGYDACRLGGDGARRQAAPTT